MAVKVLTPEQLYDSLAAGARRPTRTARHGPPKAPRQAGQGGARQIAPRSQFVTFFEDEDASDPTEYQAGIPQALRLMNAPQLNNATLLDPHRCRPSKTPDQIIEQLYLATLSRRPTAEETTAPDRSTSPSTRAKPARATATCCGRC